MTALSIQNPLCLCWQYESLTVAVLGGIKLEGLDRLRVTLKIDNGSDTLRHNLDLYNETHTDKYTRKIAERFGIGTAYISRMLGELTNELETYRLAELDKQQQSPDTRKLLSDQDRQAAKAFLQQPGLLVRINELIGQSGVVGEEQNRLLMYLIFTSRKREYPLHIISLAASGTGKSYLQEKVAELIPDEDKIEITVLSENAFYYFGQRELKHKLLLIEDLDGAQNVLYPLRELQSKKRISKTVAQKDKAGNTHTTSLTVEGPVSVAGCTTKESIYEDNANRSFLIYLDDSPEQDEKIMARQRSASAGLLDTRAEHAIKALLQNTQRILEPVAVRNPYAPQLQIPAGVFKPRRSNKHYLDFIEAITFIKQWQRPQHVDENTGELYIETTIEDIAEANELIAPILLRKSDELNGATRNYLEQLKSYMQQNSIDSISSKEAGKALRIPLSTVKRYHLHLLSSGHLRKVSNPEQAKSYRYAITSPEEYQELHQQIRNALDEVLSRLSDPDKLNSPVPAQQDSEPVKPATGKTNGKRLSSPRKKASDSK